MLATRGVVTRLALLLRVEDRATVEIAGRLMQDSFAIPALAFTDEQQALGWLNSPAARPR
jgi:hypothetical protein